MSVFEKIVNKLTRKGFYIELEAENMFPNTKGFVCPDNYVMQAAIEKYCIENKHELIYLSKDNQIMIQLDGKETYTAELAKRNGRLRGYVIHCLEVMEDTV